MMLLPPFMMRTAGARIMSISGARRAQTSPGLPADAHDAGFWGAKMGMVHELALPAPGAALKSGSAAGRFCGRGRGPPELGEAVKAKPLREARHCRRPSFAASRGSR